MILGRCGYKDWCEPSSLSLMDDWKSWQCLRLFATPRLSLVRRKAAQSMVLVLTNGHHVGVLTVVLLSHLWLCSDAWGRASVDSGSISSALFDGNSFSFVLCPTTSRLLSCHLCKSPIQWHEMMSQDLFVGDFRTLLDRLPYKAKHRPNELQNFTVLHPYFLE